MFASFLGRLGPAANMRKVGPLLPPSPAGSTSPGVEERNLRGDMVCWGGAGDVGMNFFSWTAECKKLSVVYPLYTQWRGCGNSSSSASTEHKERGKGRVSSASSLSSSALLLMSPGEDSSIFSITSTVCQSDWSRLSKGERNALRLQEGIFYDNLLRYFYYIFSPYGMVVILLVVICIGSFL